MQYFFNFDKLSYVQGLKDGDCILCGLTEQKSADSKLRVYEDDLFLVVVNLYPYNPGHLMIYPRRHLEDLREYSPQESAGLHTLTCRFLSILDRIYRPSAYNTGYNMGAGAGASIAHIHLHIIPRFPRELGIAELLAGKRVLVESPVDTAAKIRAALD